jgi:hypothetical protein
MGISEITYMHVTAFSASRPYPHHFTPLHHLAEALQNFVSTRNGKYQHKLPLLCFPKTSHDLYSLLSEMIIVGKLWLRIKNCETVGAVK